MTFPDDQTQNIAALVLRQVRAHPEAVALIDGTVWTYAQLWQRSEAFAKGLAALDLPPETPVAILMPRDGSMVAALLAVLWSGAAYVPIDPDDPPDRAARILDRSGCSLLLGTDDLTAPVVRLLGAATGLRVLDPDRLVALGADMPPGDCAPGHDRLAYVLFTSGSTGEPKGVEVEHRQLVHLLTAARDLLGITADDRMLAIATIAFDISVFDLFLPLILGGSFVLNNRLLIRDPALFADCLRDNAVTVLQLGPSAWRLILESGEALPRLRVAITTGEAVAPPLARRIAEAADEAWNLYGPTEVTVWATGHRLSPAADDADPDAFAAPIGQALQGYTAEIVDDAGYPVRDGADGELWIGGNGLARGYRGRPDLTAERFVQAPGQGGRRYRTGDIVRRGPDGAIRYLGRNDDQLKIRGIRIEPREVEGAVERVPEVARAAATWFARPGGGRGIIVAVVWQPGSSMPFPQLRDRLTAFLPQTMLPSRFVALDDLPLTQSGKIDRGAIRSHEAVLVEDPQGYNRALEMTDTEARLSMIWDKLLGITHTAPETNFFVEGGDSLSAIAMLLDVERAFDVRLETAALTTAPTLRQFARKVERARKQPDEMRNTHTVFPVVTEGKGPPLFFSNIDLRLGQAGQWVAGMPVYAVVQWTHGQGFVRAASIRDLAAMQVAEIRQIQPSGPYRIGGYSLGGLIAVEIARHMRAAGETVELLFLLDPMSPIQFRQRADGPVEISPGHLRPPLLDRLRTRIAAARKLPLKALPGETLEGLRRLKLWQALTYRLVDLHGRRPGPVTRALLPHNRWPAFWHSARMLAQGHVATPYDGPALAVYHDRDERHEIWSALLTGNADHRIIESTHMGLFVDPALKDWQQILKDRLPSDETLATENAD